MTRRDSLNTEEIGAVCLWIAMLVCIVVGLFLSGCTNLEPAREAQRTENAAGHSLSDFVHRVCDYAKANTDEEIATLDGYQCPAAAKAVTRLSQADRAFVALLDAYEAGQCVATIARDVPAKCDLYTAGKTLTDASVEVARIVSEMKGKGAK